MENSISSDLIRGHIDTIILRTVAETAKNSQEIIDEIAAKSDGKYELKQATLYSSLKRLENDKFVKAYWQDSPDGGRRRFFSLTEKGRALMQRNLNDWTFSRAIIDTLVDAEPTVVATSVQSKAEPIIMEKIVEVPKIVEKVVVKEVFVDKPVEVPVVVENNKTIEAKNDQKSADEYTEELNFRYILNGLIKNNQANNAKTNEEEPTDNKVSKKTVEVSNETHTDFSKEIRKTNSAKEGRADFGDIIDECAKSGIKLRISKKYTSVTSAGIKINLLTAISAVMIFALVALELVLINVKYSDILPNWFWFSILICSIFPIAMCVRAVQNPNRVIYRYLAIKNVLLMSFVVVLDVALLNIAYLFLTDTDFSSQLNVVYGVIVPLVLYINTFLYFVIRSVFISGDMFKVYKSK